MRNSKYRELKKKVYYIMDLSTYSDIPSKIFLTFIMGLIFLNLVAVILETVPSLQTYKYLKFFRGFEVFSVLIFTIEYLLRLWTCTLLPKHKHFIFGRIKFMFHPMMLVDLLAILPFYLPFIFPMDLRFLRSLRLFRIFRILKMGRYSESYRVLMRVINRRKEELLTVIFVEVQLLILISTLIYFAENPHQPQYFSSIPASIWWGLCTMMSLPYAPGQPVTNWGKFLGVLIALLRIGIFTLPAGIMASAFSNVLVEHKKIKQLKEKISKGDMER